MKRQNLSDWLGERRNLSDWLGFAGLLLTLLTSALIFYGRFTAMEAREDEADRDRHEIMVNEDSIMHRLGSIEASLARLEALEDPSK